MSATCIDLLRHGEVDGALCLGGDSDPPLNAHGWAQMRSLVSGKITPWSAIMSSPLRRCAAFAREVATAHDLPLKFDRRFREIGFGAWEGRSWESLYQTEGERLMDFQRNPTSHPAPGGEAYNDFEHRIEAGWRELLASAEGQHWLLITHGGSIRVLLRRVLEIPVGNLFRLHVPYGCMSRIEYDQGMPRLIFHNGQL